MNSNDFNAAASLVGGSRVKTTKFGSYVVVFCLVLATSGTKALAKLSGNSELDAKVLYQRLAGVPLRPENPLYAQIVALVAQNKIEEAAAMITHPTTGDVRFYELTVRNIASTFNRYENSLMNRLNDFMAFYIGIVRDSGTVGTDSKVIGVDDLLTANFLYNDPTVTGTNAYSASNNTHFEFIATRPTGFARSLARFVPAEFAHVGAFDTRTFGFEFSRGGTLRRPYEALIQLFYAVSQKSVMMTDLPSSYRRDFPTVVNGNMPIEQNTSPNCVGCHRNMDPISRVFLDRHWSDARGRLEIFAPTANGFDQVNEVNRPEQLATSTQGELLVTPKMNDEVFGFAGLNDRGRYKQADLGNLKDLMNFVVQSKGFYRGMARRIAFYVFTGRLFVLSEKSEADAQLLEKIAPEIETLATNLESHKNLRKTFEEATNLWMRY